MKATRSRLFCLVSLCLATTTNAQTVHDAATGSQEVGHCELAPPIFVPAGSSATGSGPPPMPPGAPLMIVPNWDASVLAGNDGPYNIQAGANVLNLRVNGVGILPIALTVGTMRTTQQIANELNADSTFASVADASASNLHNGGGMGAAALYIRSRGAEFGLIEIQIHAQSAHNTLGLSIGLIGPSVNAAQRAVFQQAFSDWESLILFGGNISSPYTARIAYRQAVSGGGLASASPIYSGSVIVGGFLDFDSSENWFEDPTPADDSEFAGGGGPGGMDLLMIARHELGHALGWVTDNGSVAVSSNLTSPLSMTATTASVVSTVGFADSGSFIVGGEVISYSARTATLLIGLTRAANPGTHSVGATVVRFDNDYDPGRLNIGVIGGGAHVNPAEHPGDIMRPGFSPNVRSPISLYPTAARLSLSEGATVPLSVIDPAGSAAPDGRAIAPWPDLTSALAGTAPGTPLLLTNGTYFEPSVPLVVTEIRELLGARNASAVVR